MTYYLLRQDTSIRDRWVLGPVRNVDNWRLIAPPVELMEPGGYTVDVRQEGVEVDYTLAGYAGAPVLSAKACAALAGLAEVDVPHRHVVLAPLVVVGRHSQQTCALMIVETRLDCVDERRSEFERFERDDPVRPDLAGQYQCFFNLVVDPARTASRHIFRLEKYPGALVVSGDVKARFERAGVVGARFDSVDGDARTVA